MVVAEKEETHHVVGMAANPIVGTVWRLAEPLCRGEGMELVHVAYHREPGGRTLRVYIDKPGGVTLDDCVNISRQLSDLLDVGLEAEAAYRLEVSSPGEQRPLGKLEDFERFRGCRAKVRSGQPIEGRKNFTGTLEGCDGTNVLLALEQKTVSIVFTDIMKAHLINYDGENPCS